MKHIEAFIFAQDVGTPIQDDLSFPAFDPRNHLSGQRPFTTSVP